MLMRTLIAAAALALAGCATTQDQYTSVNKEFIKDDKGHVVGERESLRNSRTGDVIERVELYVMLLNSEGQLIGYEQLLKSGSIVRDSEGNPIGTRYIDLRSRNPSGVLILY